MMPSEREIENEKALLGGMLSDSTAVSEACETVAVDDLFTQQHRDIFTAIVEVWSASSRGGRIDLALVYDRLRKEKKIGDPGRDAAYLVELTERDPTGANVAHSARLVREFSLRNRLHSFGGFVVAEAESPSCSADELAGEVQQRALLIGGERDRGQTLHARECVKDFAQEMAARASRKGTTGVASGLIDLDKITSGFQDGELILLAARPSVGKSALAIQIANQAASANVGTLFFSLEMSRTELISRMASAESGVNSQVIRNGRLNRDETEKINEVTGDIAALPLWINDSSTQKTRHIFAASRRLKASAGIGLVVIDYLQLIDPEDGRAPRQEQVASISRTLKKIARELSLPLICLAQLNRQVENRADAEPRLSDLKESGALEQDADVVILLHRTETQDDLQPVETIKVRVAKQRNGPTGACALIFRKAATRFENLAKGIPL